MTDSCGNMGFFTGRKALFTVIVVYLRIGFAKGNSFEVFTQPSGEFSSPGYPELDDDTHCTWKIVLPQYHRIRIEFLDFQLLERNVCEDEVEIYDGAVKIDTYKGTDLHQKIITSSGNTMSVVLMSCDTSWWFDRRGILVSYSTVYPTTLRSETSKKVMTTPQPSTKAMPTEITSQRTFLVPTSIILSNAFTIAPISPTSVELSTRLRYSNHYSKQEGSRSFLPVLLAGFLVFFLLLLIISIVVVKRRKAKLSSNATTTSTSNTDANNYQPSPSNTVTESTSVTNSQSAYNCMEGPEIRNKNENVRLEGSRVIFSPKMSSPRLKKKQPMFKRDNDTCVYENNASNLYNNTDFNEDYGAVSCTSQQASPKVENNDGGSQPICSDMNSDEGVVINTVYEPYIQET